MISFYDKLEENIENYEEITALLINFDYMLKSLHNNGFCIYDFNLKKIMLYDDKLVFASFKDVINDIGISSNMKELNLFQISKIGLMAYNNSIVDGKMNQEHFDFIRDNLNNFNINGNIPNEIFEYYGELFQRLNVVYLSDYLKENEKGNQNTNVLRKTLSTEIGRAFVDDNSENAFVNILFIPSIIVFIYIISLFIYIFIIK